ncbi:MAG: UDP-glucose dehydrogenase family protein [Candidatus Limnocylindrales bacterium]
MGAGYVGLTTAVGFASLGHRVELVENDAQRLETLRRGRLPFTEPGLDDAFRAVVDAGGLVLLDGAAGTTADIVLVCVGTPIDDDGHADTRAVVDVLAELDRRAAYPIVIVRSTLPVGTCEALLRDRAIVDPTRFFVVPEFLRQGSALNDFRRPTRVVIGRGLATDAEAQGTVVELFAGFEAPMLLVSNEEAELIKNGANAFLALKISFANEIAGLAERSGADAGPVLEGIGLDPRIGPAMFRPGFGFGGSCLPKELQTIAMSGRERGLPMHVTLSAAEANLAHQRQFAERIDRLVGGVSGRTIGLLGLSFKAGTDDIRSSPAVELARWLIAHDASVHAYDPAASGNAARAVPGLVVRDSALEALTGADAAVIATEWPEFAALDWAAARPTMATPLVVDGRRLLDPSAMLDLGFTYARVGTPSGEPAAALR